MTSTHQPISLLPPGAEQLSRPLRPGLDPSRVGPYETLRRLGGSFGGCSVYLGRRSGDAPPGEFVALKILPVDAPDDVWLRFHREGTYAERISSPQVAAIRAVGADDHYRFIAQEFVAGPTLEQELAARPGGLPITECLRLGDGLLRGLAAIHGAGLVHRDLKPANIILTDDRPVIVDLGIAKLFGEDPLTRTDQSLGSYRFMSPEQAGGEPLTQASDLYSWGLVMALASSGVHPADPTGRCHELVTLENIRTGRLDLGAVPPRLVRVISGVLLVDPARRPTLGTLLKELRSVLPAAPAAADPTAVLPPAGGTVAAFRAPGLGSLRDLRAELAGNDLLFAGLVVASGLSGLLAGGTLAAFLT